MFMHRPKARERQTKARPTEDNVTTVDELVGYYLSQESQKKTSFSTPYIQIDGSNTVQHRTYNGDLGLKCLFYQDACWLLLLVFLTFIFHKVV